MKKSFQFIIFISFFLYLSLNLIVAQKRFQEKVTVTAIEVPVRVFYKGKAVKNLTQEDFELYENGIKQNITGFEIVSRKLSSSQQESQATPKRRLFIFIFNIFDYNEAVGEGIDYFFENFFRRNDQLLIIVNNRIINIEIGKDSSQIANTLKETLKKYKRIFNLNFFKAFRDLKQEGDRLFRSLRGEYNAFTSNYQALFRFFKNYQRIWKDYHKPEEF